MEVANVPWSHAKPVSLRPLPRHRKKNWCNWAAQELICSLPLMPAISASKQHLRGNGAETISSAGSASRGPTLTSTASARQPSASGPWAPPSTRSPRPSTSCCSLSLSLLLTLVYGYWLMRRSRFGLGLIGFSSRAGRQLQQQQRGGVPLCWMTWWQTFLCMHRLFCSMFI
jgi:hypothetical protein